MSTTPEDLELLLLEAAHRVAVTAEQLERYGKRARKMLSRDGAQSARKDVVDAILRLQVMERLLTSRIDEQRHHGG
jgi:hypothetical protein